MTAKKLAELTANLKNNGGMIRVYRENARSMSEVLRTFNVEEVIRFLRKKTGSYTVSQAAK